ncbi:MAG: hypothetical protein WC043_02155 [Pseudobdellovibrionaceae bacterium]
MPVNIPTTAHLVLGTNEHLKENPDASNTLASHYHIAYLHTDTDHNLEFRRQTPTAVKDADIQHILQDQYHLTHLTRSEIQEPHKSVHAEDLEKNLPKNLRLVVVAAALSVKIGDDEFFPLLQRNGNVPESGLWTIPSGFVSRHPLSAFARKLNGEFGATVNNQIVVVKPTDAALAVDSNVVADSLTYKKGLKERVPLLKRAFENTQGSHIIVDAQTVESPALRTVLFHGCYDGELNCFAYDEPARRTFTMIVPQQIELDKNSKRYFDPEGFGRVVTWVDKETLTHPDLKTTQALKAYIKTLSL